MDGEGPVVPSLDAAGGDEPAGAPYGARHQGLAVAADDEDAVGARRRVLALTRRGSCGPRTRCRILGLAACDRPYRTGVRACGGRPPGAVPGAVIRRRMQRPELAVRRHPRYPGVRFMDRCHCCCSLTVGSAGWTCLGSAPKVKLRHYRGDRERGAWDRGSGLVVWSHAGRVEPSRPFLPAPAAGGPAVQVPLVSVAVRPDHRVLLPGVASLTRPVRSPAPVAVPACTGSRTA